MHLGGGPGARLGMSGVCSSWGVCLCHTHISSHRPLAATHTKSFGMLWDPLAMHLNSIPSRLTTSGYFHSTTLPEGEREERERKRKERRGEGKGEERGTEKEVWREGQGRRNGRNKGRRVLPLRPVHEYHTTCQATFRGYSGSTATAQHALHLCM